MRGLIIWLRLLRKLLDNIIFNKELSEYNDRIKKGNETVD